LAVSIWVCTMLAMFNPFVDHVLVRSKHNLRFYAVKVLNKERIHRMKQIEHTNNEQRMLQSVQHPFIINLWGVFQDAGNLYMVMDFVPGGELFTLLRRSNVFHFQIFN
jgi:protein kinase A